MSNLGVSLRVYQAFVLQERVMSEIHQQSHFEARAVEIVQSLGSVLVHDLRSRFQLHQDFGKADQVRLVEML